MGTNQKSVLSVVHPQRLVTIAALMIGICALQSGLAQPKAFIVSRADSVASLYPNHSIANLPILSQKLTSSLKTEPEKFRAIFKWVSDNISNDYALFTTNKEKHEKLSGDALREWNKAFNVMVFDKLLHDHATICTGYAYLIRELSRYAGLSCEIVDGYGRNAVSNIGGTGALNHSWNAIKLDGKWYLCDATWASGSIDPRRQSFVRKYNDVYFLPKPSLFMLNHYPLDTSWILIENQPSLHTFLNAPLAYAAAIREHITADDYSFEITLKKKERLNLSFEGPPGLNRKLSMVIGENRVSGQPVCQFSADDRCLYEFSQVLYFKGAYAVHVLMNDEYLYSYRVIVN